LSYLDLPVRDEPAAPDVDIVPAASGEVETGDTGIVDAVIEFEACLFKTG